MISFQPLESSADTTAWRCLDLIARNAPRFMRCGGGPLEQQAQRGELTRDKQREILRLRRAKMRPALIAARVKLSVMTVWKVCRRAGLNRKRARDFSPEELARMWALRQGGWSLPKLAREFACSVSTVERRTRGAVRGHRRSKILAPLS